MNSSSPQSKSSSSRRTESPKKNSARYRDKIFKSDLTSIKTQTIGLSRKNLLRNLPELLEQSADSRGILEPEIYRYHSALRSHQKQNKFLSETKDHARVERYLINLRNHSIRMTNTETNQSGGSVILDEMIAQNITRKKYIPKVEQLQHDVVNLKAVESLMSQKTKEWVAHMSGGIGGFKNTSFFKERYNSMSKSKPDLLATQQYVKKQTGGDHLSPNFDLKKSRNLGSIASHSSQQQIRTLNLPHVKTFFQSSPDPKIQPFQPLPPKPTTCCITNPRDDKRHEKHQSMLHNIIEQPQVQSLILNCQDYSRNKDIEIKVMEEKESYAIKDSKQQHDFTIENFFYKPWISSLPPRSQSTTKNGSSKRDFSGSGTASLMSNNP